MVAPAPTFTPEEYRQKPRERTSTIVDTILLRVANGDTLLTVCRDLDMPLPSVFADWCEEDPRLAERYENALLRHVEVCFDQVGEMAGVGDTMRARVTSEAMKWRVERSLPAKYGPRAIVKEVGDADAGGGIDHAAEVRRRIEDMARRRAASGD